jgi:Spy/CpxP family protein refolding chaperone
MKARFLSRLSIVSFVAVTALGAAACSRASTTDTQSTAAASEASKTAAARQGALEHGPGYRVFRQIDGLDLRASQRASFAELEQNLRADLAPHRETVRQVAQTLAAGIETGRIDARESVAQQAALVATLADMRASVASALNEVHDTLDAAQRAQLVTQLRAQHVNERAREEAAPQDQGGLAKIAFELGLSEDQKQAIRDAVQRGADDVFPDRKVRREAWEAKMKTLGDAFVTEDFDAADFDLASGAEDGIKSFSDASARAIDVAGTVLSDGQRASLAAMIRTHAEKI